MSNQIPQNLLFRYRLNCPYLETQPTGHFELPAPCRIRSFGPFEKRDDFADFRIGWREEGIYLSVQVTGKKRALKCQASFLHESDSIQLWIDTRATHDVHRATKFCHWIVLMPVGDGPDLQQASGRMLKINRCKEPSPTINRGKLTVRSTIKKNGYHLSAFIPKETLYGWNPAEQRQLGFNYGVIDTELGWQTLAIGPELPISEDPSLWQTLVLEKSVS